MYGLREWLNESNEWLQRLTDSASFHPKLFILWRKISGSNMKYVTCHLLPLPKDSNKYTLTNIPRQKEGKYFTSKEQKDNATIKKKMYYDHGQSLTIQVLHLMRATKNMAYQRCFRQCLPGCVPGLLLLFLNFSFKYLGRHSYFLIPE